MISTNDSGDAQLIVTILYVNCFFFVDSLVTCMILNGFGSSLNLQIEINL